MDEEKINQVKEIIKKNFKNGKFTTGDIYYSIEKSYDTSKFGTSFDIYINKVLKAIEKSYDTSKFGTIRNIIVQLTKEKYLDYIIEVRGSPHYNSENKKKGASYSLLKH